MVRVEPFVRRLSDVGISTLRAVPRRAASLAVFGGPSLAKGESPNIPGVTYLPPARRGDIRDAARHYDAVLLIDGVFHHDLAPSPKEVYEACIAVHFFGAASLGAVRAAECAPYGATPIGAIARWYLHEVIDGDDEVAVLAHPETHRMLSVPAVNVRYLAWLGRRRGLLTMPEAERLIRGARDTIYYMDRTWDAVLTFAPADVRGALRRIALMEGNLKRLDAIFALRTVSRRLGLLVD